MIENRKNFSFDEVKPEDPDNIEIYDATAESGVDIPMETASPFPSALIPQTIVTLLCLIIILLVSGNKNNHWAKWMREKIHYAVNASTAETFGYISNLSVCKDLMRNIDNFIKLEEITQNISTDKLFLTSKNSFQISVWPVQGNIIRNFGWTENQQSKKYEFIPGVLFKSFPGDEVAAVEDGEVTQVTRAKENEAGAGLTLIINHGAGWSTIYHDLRNVRVNIGQAVRAGDSFAQTNGKELFFEVKYNEEPVDPSTLNANQNNAAI